MKLLFIILFLLISFFNAHAKGIEGEYIIAIQMLDKTTEKPLCNKIFLLNGDTLKTDEMGKLTYKISWSLACGYGLNFLENYRESKAMNPKYLKCISDASEQKIKNKWRKYGVRQESKDLQKSYSIKLYW